MGGGDIVGWGLSALGVVISVYALRKAESAQRAAALVVEKSSDQAARDTARDLLGLVNKAKDAAMARRRGAGRSASFGRSRGDDIAHLQKAQDALAIVTITTDQEDQDLRAAAVELQHALDAIALNTNEDGWGVALFALQAIYPKINAVQRGLGAKALR